MAGRRGTTLTDRPADKRTPPRQEQAGRSTDLGTGLREESLANAEHGQAFGSASRGPPVNSTPTRTPPSGRPRELIQSTAEVVLHEWGLPVDDRDHVPALLKQASASLDLAPGHEAAVAVKRILGGLTNGRPLV